METNTNFTTTNDGKSASIVSYITFIGWLISYFGMYKENKTSLSTFHLRQSLLLHATFIGINIVLNILIRIMPTAIFGYISLISGIVYLIFMILGAIAANSGEKKPLPVFGEKAQTMFPSI